MLCAYLYTYICVWCGYMSIDTATFVNIKSVLIHMATYTLTTKQANVSASNLVQFLNIRCIVFGVCLERFVFWNTTWTNILTSYVLQRPSNGPMKCTWCQLCTSCWATESRCVILINLYIWHSFCCWLLVYSKHSGTILLKTTDQEALLLLAMSKIGTFSMLVLIVMTKVTTCFWN